MKQTIIKCMYCGLTFKGHNIDGLNCPKCHGITIPENLNPSAEELLKVKTYKELEKGESGNKIPEPCYEPPENPIKEKEKVYMNYKKVIENQIETLEERQKRGGLSVEVQCLIAKTIAEITEIADKIKPGID